MRVGLTAYLKTLADEVGADGVIVNTVCTGMFGTERLEELFQARAEANGTSAEQERAQAVASIPVGRVGNLEEFGAFLRLPRLRPQHLRARRQPPDRRRSRPLPALGSYSFFTFSRLSLRPRGRIRASLGPWLSRAASIAMRRYSMRSSGLSLDSASLSIAPA